MTKTRKDRDGDILALCNPNEGWLTRKKEDAINDIENGNHQYYVVWVPPEDFEYDEPIATHPNFDWSAYSEPDIDGYNIYKKKMGEQSFTKQNTSLITSITWTDPNEVVDTENGVAADYYVTAVGDDANESDCATAPIKPFKLIVFW